MTATGTDERRTNTRELIRRVAMELFAEQGYDKTSLREIAERLGVTKAAVYYHFRTKEEIITSLFDEQLAAMDAVVEWGETQPVGPGRTRGVLERYSAMLAASIAPNLIRFLQENQTAFKALAGGAQMRERFAQMGALMVPEGASIAELLRARLALIALHHGAFAVEELPGTREERFAAALDVALDVVGCSPGDVATA